MEGFRYVKLKKTIGINASVSHQCSVIFSDNAPKASPSATEMSTEGINESTNREKVRGNLAVCEAIPSSVAVIPSSLVCLSYSGDDLQGEWNALDIID